MRYRIIQIIILDIPAAIRQSGVIIGIITGFELLYGKIVDDKMYYPTAGYMAESHSGTSIAWGISVAIRMIEEYKEKL